jgi:LAGLIDADG DNA endonuclease family protein
MDSHDLAYLAGLIDGEGTIFVQRVKNRNEKISKSGFHYRAGLAINMTDQATVKWAKEITGVGKISGVRRHKKNHKPGFRWSVWSKQSSTLLLLLLPYLRLKKPHAENLIRFQFSMRLAGRNGNTKQEMARREKHRQISLRLNKKGR